MNILKDKTKSICPICYAEIDAQIIEEANGVYLIKECPTHGKFNVLIEKDPLLYKKLLNSRGHTERESFNKLSISLTHLCNLKCNICYLPKRNNYDFPFEDVKRVIAGFEGKYIRLAGGEPTLRKDLPQIINYIVVSDKTPILVTNGIKLADYKYAKKLKDAGLGWVHFSFNGFSNSAYEKINGKKLLRNKLIAIKNLKRLRINTILSIMLVRGVNEGELKRVYRYSIKNNHFIKELRIRASSFVGRYIETEPLYLSEMVDMLSKIIGIEKEKLIDHCFQRNSLACSLKIDLLSLLMNEKKLRDANSIIKKAHILFWLFSKLGIKNTIQMIIRKHNKDKRPLDFTIQIRVRPDKYTIDLDEIRKCPSAYVTTGGKKMLSLCYAVILNEKNDIL